MMGLSRAMRRMVERVRSAGALSPNDSGCHAGTCRALGKRGLLVFCRPERVWRLTAEGEAFAAEQLAGPACPTCGRSKGAR